MEKSLPLDRERGHEFYNAQILADQVNWDLVSQNKESIAYIRSDQFERDKSSCLRSESYDKIYQQVFINLQLIVLDFWYLN